MGTALGMKGVPLVWRSGGQEMVEQLGIRTAGDRASLIPRVPPFAYLSASLV